MNYAIMFLPSGITLSMFFLLWIVMWPNQVIKALKFKDNIFICLANWLAVFAFVGTITFLSSKLV